ALDVFEAWKPELVLLDVMLPGEDGWSILRSIRERTACPVIMLTALNETEDRVSGLKGGADDYIGKPFTGEEVVARVEAVLRRLPLLHDDETVQYGSLEVNFSARSVKLRGKPVHLTPRDLALLLF